MASPSRIREWLIRNDELTDAASIQVPFDYSDERDKRVMTRCMEQSVFAGSDDINTKFEKKFKMREAK